MGNRRALCGVLVVVSTALAAAHGAGAPARFEFVEPHMGTRVRIVLYAPDETTAKRASQAAFQRIADLNRIMSDYLPTSELMLLCAKAGGPPVPVSPDLFAVLQRSTEVARQSDGAFDVTIGPVVRLWRLSRRTQLLPDPTKLAAARSLVGREKIVLDAATRSVRLTHPGMQLDLGGIGKGYAAEEAVKVLKAQGTPRALVALSGDIVAGDPPPDADGWRVAIGAVAEGEPEPPALLLRNAAVSTSGDAVQYVEIAGKRYAHIVDPRTALGMTEVFQVTVVARDGATADALDTALAVMGPKKGLELIERVTGASARFARMTGGKLDEHRSKMFPAPAVLAGRKPS